MTTLTVNINDDGGDIKKIVDTLQKMKGVMNVTIEKNDVERIPGLTYSDEERALHLREDMAEYKAGKADLKSHEDFLKEIFR